MFHPSFTKDPMLLNCGVIIEKDDKILLQRNPGETHWQIPGGMMQHDEKYEEAAIRGVMEETNLTIEKMQFYGMLSGRDCLVTNKFGDKAVILQVMFFTTKFSGKVKILDHSCREHRFFKRNNLPKNLNPQHKSFISDWKAEKPFPIIK
ncbi:NUDIX domain-containing protein [Bacillus sp. 1P06AnD]|uniref:NUDIX domain-containing protein n=1 Tax=Bacillus sp. 1P06AnD TaxID=3132208 RepID=UPI0039A13F18